MKKLILMSIAIFTMNQTFAQKIKYARVPAVIKKAFVALYPTAKASEWELEDENYETKFTLNDVEQSALFDKTGKLVETEVEIMIGELPKQAAEYLAKKQPNEKIKKASKITDANGVVTFEAEVNGKDILFGVDGKFIKIIKSK